MRGLDGRLQKWRNYLTTKKCGHSHIFAAQIFWRLLFEEIQKDSILSLTTINLHSSTNSFSFEPPFVSNISNGKFEKMSKTHSSSVIPLDKIFNLNIGCLILSIASSQFQLTIELTSPSAKSDPFYRSNGFYQNRSIKIAWLWGYFFASQTTAKTWSVQKKFCWLFISASYVTLF